MTKMKDGILLGYQASSGSMVGSVVNGVARLSESESKRDARGGQIVHRERFALVRYLVNLFQPALAVGFRNFVTPRRRVCAVGMSMFYNKVLFPDPESALFDFSKLQLSKGILLPFSGLNHQFTNGVLKISWKKPQRDLNGDDTDLIYLVVYYPELEQMEIFAEDIRRSDLKLDFSFDQDLPASVAHCYLFIASEITNAVSNSYYISVPNFKV